MDAAGMDPMTLILIQQALAMACDAAKAGARRATELDPVQKAIMGTSACFVGVPGLRYQLADWCASSELRGVLEHAIASGQNPAESGLVDSFVKFGYDESGEGTPPATDVVGVFLQILVEETMASRKGLYVHDQRMQALHRDSTGQVVGAMQQAAADIRADIQGLKVNNTGDTGTEGSRSVLHSVESARVLIAEGKTEAARLILERASREQPVPQGAGAHLLHSTWGSYYAACYDLDVLPG